MTYKNIQNAAKKTNQLTLNNLISNRFYHKKLGWIKLNINDIDLDSLVSLIGGRGYNYSSLIKDYIEWGSSYGILDRLIYSTDRKRWEYIAGQDYTAELNTIRKIFREGR